MLSTLVALLQEACVSAVKQSEIDFYCYQLISQTKPTIKSTCLKWPLIEESVCALKTGDSFMRPNLLQKAPEGAFCNTFDLH